MNKRAALVFLAGLLLSAGIYRWMFWTASMRESVRFDIASGETAAKVGERLEADGLIRSALLFRVFAARNGLDTKLAAGTYTFDPPITLFRVLSALASPEARSERTITIIPGWDLRDIAAYLEREGIASSTAFLRVTGTPAAYRTPAFSGIPSVFGDKPNTISLEGYLAPNTYRIYADATADDIVKKLVLARADEWEGEMIARSVELHRSVHEVMTMASIVEREAKGAKDRAMVADIFWRRLDAGWGLQADSTVHYLTGKRGDVFTTDDDRRSASLWNTYKYAGLPPGPIANPSVESIRAALYPEKNSYWYFLTTLDGEMKYAKTSAEHEANVRRYLR
jgi:UPF0755 protein